MADATAALGGSGASPRAAKSCGAGASWRTGSDPAPGKSGDTEPIRSAGTGIPRSAPGVRNDWGSGASRPATAGPDERKDPEAGTDRSGPGAGTPRSDTGVAKGWNAGTARSGPGAGWAPGTGAPR
ncbi:hypothetical protein ACFWA0_39470, partial [Streptomyces xanthophaeus]